MVWHSVLYVATVNSKSYAGEKFCGLMDFYHNLGKTSAVYIA